MRKVFDSLTGLILGLVVVLLINGLLQGLAANILLGQPSNFSFHGIKLDAEFTIDPNRFWSSFFVVMTPVLLSIIFIEIIIVLLTGRLGDKYNIVLIISQLVITGYILVFIISGIISVLFRNSVSHDFVNLLQSSGYSYKRQLIFMLMSAFFVFGYINIILKRLRKNLPGIAENKTGNINGSKK